MTDFIEHLEKSLNEQINSIELNGEQGNLNSTYLVVTEKRKCILQLCKSANTEEIYNYLKQLYRTAGFLNRGNGFKLRDYREKVRFYKTCELLNLRVPKLLSSGEDYLLTEYIEGTNYLKFKSTLSYKELLELYWMLLKAHSHYLIFGDRWAGNLIVSDEGAVYFIDFDIQYTYKNTQQMVYCRNFEIAVITYDLILYSKDRGITVSFLKRIFSNGWFNCCYDKGLIFNYLWGYSKFYTNTHKPLTSTSLPLSEHINTREYINALSIKLHNQKNLIVV